MIVIWIISFMALIISAITDIKENIIYPSLFICITLCCTAYSAFVLHNFVLLSSLVASVLVGFVFLIGTRFGGGGGDVIMMASLAWIFGLNISLYICVFSLFEYIIGLTIIANRRKVSVSKLTLPFAPFVLSGTLTSFVFVFIVNQSYLS